MNIQLLDKSIPVDRRDDVAANEWDLIGRRLATFPGSVNAAAALDQRQRDIMLQTDGIVVFRSVRFKRLTMTRSFMDLDHALFHWHVHDLTAPGYNSPERVATFYFHDAFHVQQFRRNDRAQDLDSMVRREVEATNAQVAFGETVGADDGLLDDLRDYAASPDRIKARLKSGTGFFAWLMGRPRYAEHFEVH